MNWALWSTISGLLILIVSTIYQICVNRNIEKRISRTGNLKTDIIINTKLANGKSKKLARASLLTFAGLILTYALSLTGVAMDKNTESLDERIDFIEEYLFGGPPGPGTPTRFQLEQKLNKFEEKLDDLFLLVSELSASTTRMKQEEVINSAEDMKKVLDSLRKELPKEIKSQDNREAEG